MNWHRERVRIVDPHVRPGAAVEAIADAAGLTMYDTALALRDITRRDYSRALREGALIRPDRCSDCETGGVIHGHHPDYTRPLHVEWLCVRCHRSRHTTQELRAYRRKDMARRRSVRGLLTTRDAAAALGVSRQTIYSRVRSGALPHLRIGRVIRFRPSDIERVA